MSVAPETIEDVVSDLVRGLDRIKAKREVYDTRQQYQDGTRREVVSHPELKTLIEKFGAEFQVNYAGVPAVALNDRRDLLGLRTGDESADTLLSERFWMPNDLDNDADDLHLRASYLGDYYGVLELVEDEGDQVDGEGESSTGIGTVELTPKDPRWMVVVYQRANSRIPDFGVQIVDKGSGRFDLFVYYDDETFRFTTRPGVAKDFDGFDIKQYQIVADEEDDPITTPNPGGFPVLHWRPDSRPYGTPVNAKAYGPQNGITKLMATMMAGVDYHGLPERYALLKADRPFGSDIASDFNDALPAGGEQPGNPKGSPKLTSKPGGFAFLEGVDETGTYQTNDPKSFTDPMQILIRAAATLTRTPLYEFDLDGGGDQPSGEARRRADAPITKHAKKLNGQDGAVWAAAGRWALKALGQSGTAAVTAVWAPPETASDKEGFELAAQKVKAGISPRQALIEAGYTAEQLTEWWGPADQEQGMRMTPDLLSAISTALQSLGQARGLGAVGGEEVRLALFPYFGTTAAPEPDATDAGAAGA